MPEITCDYMVPMTVGVNTDTGEVTHVELHLESFQSSPPGWFTGRNGECTTVLAFRQAFVSDNDDREDGDGYAVDGESVLGDKALAIADRVRITNEPLRIEWALDPEWTNDSLREQFRQHYPGGIGIPE